MGFFKQVKDTKAMVAEAPALVAQSAPVAEQAATDADGPATTAGPFAAPTIYASHVTPAPRRPPAA
jgi:hypothetical protein